MSWATSASKVPKGSKQHGGTLVETPVYVSRPAVEFRLLFVWGGGWGGGGRDVPFKIKNQERCLFAHGYWFGILGHYMGVACQNEGPQDGTLPFKLTKRWVPILHPYGSVSMGAFSWAGLGRQEANP